MKIEIQNFRPNLNEIFAAIDFQFFARIAGARGNSAEKIRPDFEKFTTEISAKKILRPAGIFTILPPEKFAANFAPPNFAKFLKIENRELFPIFIGTAGAEIFAAAHRAQKNGEFARAHFLNSIGLAAAESCAELLHRKICALLKIEKSATVRLSPGFAVFDLQFQKNFFAILRPEKLGIFLTENWTMNPIGTVSAGIFGRK